MPTDFYFYNEKPLVKVKHKIEDHMLLGSIYDNIMLKVKYNEQPLSKLYNIMMGQKHRMLNYKRLKKKYLKRCISSRPWESEEKKFNSDIVWFSWLQGIDAAPPVVKRCYESIKKNLPDKKVILVDEKNMFDYVEFPDYIVEKWKSGKMVNAHFSDLLRINLLIKHGGYWIDSTVLCTDGAAFKYYDKAPLFMYSYYYFNFNPEIMELNNWFIHSTSNNNILCLTRELLYTYWKENNRAIDYFIFHLFLRMALECYPKEYYAMPCVSQADSQILSRSIGEQYDEDKYQMMKMSTGIHKLSTRFGEGVTDRANTFYDVVINKGKY